jgi:hypothetical protein
MNKPWAHEELHEFFPEAKTRLEKQIREIEANEEARPLPPLSKDECIKYFFRLMDAAVERPLTRKETFIHGQLLAQFEQSVLAESLGKQGRYYVISEDHIVQAVQRGQG